MQIKRLLIIFNLFIFTALNVLNAMADDDQDRRDSDNVKLHNVNYKHVYYKVDQGISTGIILDQKMSNLHYTGPGALINFGRRVYTPDYIAEWNFLRINFGYLEPEHKGTQVYKPSLGVRYLHLRNLNSRGIIRVHAGLQANLFADVRIAPRLGNSYLFADIIGEVRPQCKLSTSFYFLRQWNVDFSLSATLTGIGIRYPEYGTTFMLSGDGGIAFQPGERHILKLSNFGHVTTGIFLDESFGNPSNPNRYRIGYIWDYYSMKGNHNLNVNNAVHQLVLEFYFKVN